MNENPSTHFLTHDFLTLFWVYVFPWPRSLPDRRGVLPNEPRLLLCLAAGVQAPAGREVGRGSSGNFSVPWQCVAAIIAVGFVSGSFEE